MDDIQIIELFWVRSDDAVNETDMKYGKMCRHIIKNILNNEQDEEECLGDTYLSLWNAIPPERPNILSAYIGRIAINQALKKYNYNKAKKRKPETISPLSELEEIVSGTDSIENELESRRIKKIINDFLWQQSEEKRLVFINRYWYNESIATISKRSGFSESKVTSMLYHTRHKLKAYLESEGVIL